MNKEIEIVIFIPINRKIKIRHKKKFIHTLLIKESDYWKEFKRTGVINETKLYN